MRVNISFLITLLIFAIEFSEIYLGNVQHKFGQTGDISLIQIKNPLKKNIKLKLGLPFSRFKVNKTLKSLEELLVDLEDISQKKRQTKNPFLKLRYFIQERNIKRKIKKRKQMDEEESKLERLDEELPMDYSPQALSEEGSVPPYLPVTVESSISKQPISDIKVTGDISKSQSDIQGVGSEDLEAEVGQASGISGLEKVAPEKQADESEKSEFEAMDIGEKTELEEDVEFGGRESGDAEGADKDEEASGAEGADEAEAEETEEAKVKKEAGVSEIVSDGSKRRGFSGIVRDFLRCGGKVSKLEDLLEKKEELDAKLLKTRSSLGRKLLNIKLKKIEKKIAELTENAIDEIEKTNSE